ncbi:hypothetical protein BC936DRAFT_148266 [Jimgerdemannia flammicorona]|uniref:Uncharacterized protein n=1 Tax=Jimgerdemannia flammicorona TaxID=994334 RepID=A0A433D3F1_9FUNG|nr:hypothetical protein BC936DRAFT_148266 [Jimgerdemannia flammicorona]
MTQQMASISEADRPNGWATEMAPTLRAASPVLAAPGVTLRADPLDTWVDEAKVKKNSVDERVDRRRAVLQKQGANLIAGGEGFGKLGNDARGARGTCRRRLEEVRNDAQEAVPCEFVGDEAGVDELQPKTSVIRSTAAVGSLSSAGTAT